ncbi:class I SAM-dependent methyltransferase family protein [Neisseria sp. WLZKY-1]
MRHRSQQETDQLVEAAGFEKIRQWIDGDGIFTVSLAVKK